MAVVAAVLLTFEAGMRVFEKSLSVDIRHILSVPQLASSLSGQSRPRVLGIGNSLLREGLDAVQLREEMMSTAATASFTFYHPDGTSVQEWAYVFRRYFSGERARPDCVLIFTGRTHLRDLAPRPTPMGAFYCATSDIPAFLVRGGGDPDIAAEFLLARISVAFAERERVRPRVFTSIIPRYQEVLREMNARHNASQADRAVDWTYDDLRLLLGSIRETGALPVLVTVPAPDSYRLAPEIEAIAKESGVPILDLANSGGTTRWNFPDGWHLDASGARLFTHNLAVGLAAIPRLGAVNRESP